MAGHGSIAYYEVAAQVIPIILLALVIEYRVFRRDDADVRPSIGVSVGAVLIALVFVVAEFDALDAVKTQHASAFADFIVGLALGVGFVMLAVLPTQSYFDDLLDRVGARRRRARTSRPNDAPSEHPDDGD
jgi:hypothetical protein